MPSTTLTIGAGERAALYAQLTQNLTGIDDVFLSFGRRDYFSAARLGTRAAQDIRLLNDLGWLPDDTRTTFDLTMPADELVATLARLRKEVEGDSRSQKSARRDWRKSAPASATTARPPSVAN